MPAKPLDEEALFHAARRIDDAEARAVFLSQACGEDAALAQRVRALLDMHERESDASEPPSNRTGAYEPIAEQVGTKIGPYLLREQIGEGGFGLVFVAEQTEPVKRKVALKVIKPGMDTREVMARFAAERQALALMDHPNIARVLDAGATDSGRPYFVMELVRGIPITEYCDKNQLPPKDRLDLFVTVCQAIQHAHQKGIIHRDVKPSNVLVTSHDGKPVAKVIDFGVAKAINQQLAERSIYTNFAQMIGTPLYMSPEQAEMSGLDIDTRSDIYSLGVLLYELLTGTTPLDRKKFAKAAYDEVRRLIREEEPPKPSTRLGTSDAIASIAARRHTEPAKLSKLVRGDLDWITMKCLEKDRTRRYETANGLARDIQRYLTDEPVEACPPSATYRLRKFARKNRAALTTTATIAALLVGGVAVSTWQAVRAKRAEGEARAAAEAERLAKLDSEQAAAAEKAAKEQTQKRLAQIEKGVELFAGVLTGIDPRAEELGGDPLYMQLRQRAEKAADGLDAEAVGDPLAVARLQTILGNTLRELGSYAKAMEVLEKARAIRERKLGADHPDTLTTLDHLAVTYKAAGKLPEAIALFEQVRDAEFKRLGGDHISTLNTLNNLALAYRDAGKVPEAIALFEQVRAAKFKALGTDHPYTLTTLHNLASAHEAAGNLQQAIALYEQVRDAQVKTLGADHTSTLTTLNALAMAYRAAGRLPEAIAIIEQVRDARVKKLGADHPDTQATLNNLATAYVAARKLPEAIAIFEQVHDAWVKKFGADHPATLTILNNLAQVYQAAGRVPEAIALLERVRDAQVMKLGADHPDTLTTLNNLALAYQAASRLPEAIALLVQVRDAKVKKLGSDHPDTLTTFNNLALAYQTAGRLPEAIALLERAATGIAKRRFQHEYAGRIIANTIAAYDKAGQLDKAEGWRRQWLAVVKERSGADSVAYADQLAALGRNLLQQKNWAGAEPILRECLAIREKNQPNAWATFNTQSQLGGALLGQKNYADAEPLLLNGYEGMKQSEEKIPKEAKVRLSDAIDRLIELYTATNKPDDAKKWQAERANYPTANAVEKK
jgi:serine/threonine protein kinase/tetratricopeptide (TPR) repeat protein